MHQLAKPTSRKELSKYANLFRTIMGLENQFYMPIIELIELILPRIDHDFDLEIVSVDTLPLDTYAITYPDEKRMVIREDVYYGACDEQGRARFTLAHEFFHYLRHNNNNVGFARSGSDVPIYCDPEWQANTFAAELLVPKDLIKDITIEEIVEKCSVSFQCAAIQKKCYS